MITSGNHQTFKVLFFVDQAKYKEPYNQQYILTLSKS